MNYSTTLDNLNKTEYDGTDSSKIIENIAYDNNESNNINFNTLFEKKTNNESLVKYFKNKKVFYV